MNKAVVDGRERKGERLLNAAQAAMMLGLAQGTIRNMTFRGELEHVKVGKRAVRYRESTLVNWIESKTIRARV